MGCSALKAAYPVANDILLQIKQFVKLSFFYTILIVL